MAAEPPAPDATTADPPPTAGDRPDSETVTETAGEEGAGGISSGPLTVDGPCELPSGPGRIYAFADSFADDAYAREQEKAKRELETWVSFELAGEIFALPVSHVQEILRVTTITQVPHAPGPVRGVTNKRGRVLPVVDLRLRLGLPMAEVGRRSRILVIESRARLLGLLVDAVQQVVRIERAAVQEAPADIMTAQSDYILGVYPLDESLVILLDVDRVLIIRESARAVAV